MRSAPENSGLAARCRYSWGASIKGNLCMLGFAEERWSLGEHHPYSGHCFGTGCETVPSP
jgi:hypothetical protein